ncbi:hypothetical protein Goari_003066, partial [Gossypium aridum]|nr:hypothetical protein [Gossypium aridum]
WNHSPSYEGIPTVLEDIRLLLDQRSEAHTPYEDSTIRAIILDEYLQNPSIWHVRVPLVNYATIKMHQTNRYNNIPTGEPIIIPQLACDPDYMPWFRIHGKPYLLSKEKRHQQIRVEKE